MKSLPTYSIPLTDGAWEVPDAPVINEIEKSVKSYYAVNIYLLKKIFIFILFIETNNKKFDEKTENSTS